MSNTGSAGRADDLDREAPAGAENEQTLVLAVDTTTDVRSVCVARGARVLSVVTPGPKASGAAAVLSVIDEALTTAGVRFDEIELFAVAAGPGSFTGLRAGIATVKAFAAISGRPVASVPTLHAVALAAGASEQTVAAIPAGRGEVFAQLLSVEESGAVRELSEPMHVSPSSLLKKAGAWAGRIKWAGAGALLHRELISEDASLAGHKLCELTDGDERDGVASDELWTLAPKADSYAVEIARLGLISKADDMLGKAGDVQALYVRLSDAELKERCRV